MNTPSIAIKVKSVKFEYDKSDPRQVYQAIKQFYPNLSAKEFTPEIIQKFIPEGACPVYWVKTLRNVEYSLDQPKKVKRSRSKTGCYNRKHNPDEAISRQTTLAALMEVR